MKQEPWYYYSIKILTILESAAGVHPMAPNGIRPASNSSYFNASSIEPEEGVFFSRSQLSNRFQYKLPKEDEADNIITGGAEVVF